MSTFFSAAYNHELGFDSTVSPPWVVVGKGKTKQVDLNGGVGLVLHSTDPDVASAYIIDPSGLQCMGAVQTQSKLQVEIRGKNTGEAEIQARSGSLVRAKLKVAVYRKKTVKVNFFRVVGKSGGSGPSFPLAQAAEVLKRMNHVYKAQTRIHFESHLLIDNVKLNIDFASADQSADKQSDIWNELNNKRKAYDSANSHLNVFCVRTWGARDHICKKKDCHEGSKNVIGTAHGNLCIVEDMTSLEKRVLLMAHELGHSLNAKHDKTHESALMYPYANGGQTIFKKTVRQLRSKPKKA